MTTWSGIPFMAKAVLSRTYEVIEINPANNWFINFIEKIFTSIGHRLGLKYDFRNSILLSLLSYPSIFLNFELKHRDKSSVVVAMAMTSELLFLPSRLKLVLYGDIIKTYLIHNYPDFIDCLSLSKREMQWIEKMVMKKSKIVVFPSNWALELAEKQYNLKGNIKVIAYGPIVEDEYDDAFITQRLAESRLRVLFVSTNWQRKGGEFVVGFVQNLLEEINYQVEINIVGEGTIDFVSPRLTVVGHGRLNKEKSEDMQTYLEVLKTTDFLILPTMADTTPVSIIEAMCFGIPVITTEVGGIPEMLVGSDAGLITDGSNYPEMTSWVQHRFKNEAYVRSSRASRSLYLEKYNWNHWHQGMHKLIEEIG